MSRNLAQKVLYILIAIPVGWLFLRYFLPISLPFLLGLGAALAAEPGVKLLSRRLPRPAATAISVTLVLVLLTTVLALVLGILMRQLGRLQTVLPQLEAAANQGIALLKDRLLTLSQVLPQGLSAAISRLLEGDGPQALITQQALEKIPQMAADLVSRLSSGLFGVITGILSGYMLSARLPALRAWCRTHLPPVWQERYVPAARSIRKSLSGWLLAQCQLAGVAFVLLLVGFWLLKIANPLVLAVLITVVDAFPILGVGTVLLPWSLVLLLQGDLLRGFGILGLYGIIWLVRSVLEPKLVGKGLGIDPLVTLLSIYAGWRLLGITGMLLAPILAMAVVQVCAALRR